MTTKVLKVVTTFFWLVVRENEQVDDDAIGFPYGWPILLCPYCLMVCSVSIYIVDFFSM